MRLRTHQLVAGLSTVGLLGLSAVASSVPGVWQAGAPPAEGTARSVAAAADDPVETLKRDLEAILGQPGIAEAHASVLVRTAAGDTLYEQEAAERLMPASNAKLFSSAAAMEVLGPDHRFPTSVLADGNRHGSELRGDLYLRGQGDPTLLASDYDDLAAKVAAEGITRVRGDLVADDTWFDSTRLGNSWGWDDEPFYYSGQVSALTVSPERGLRRRHGHRGGPTGCRRGRPGQGDGRARHGIREDRQPGHHVGKRLELHLGRTRARHQHHPRHRHHPSRRQCRPVVVDRVGADRLRRRRVPASVAAPRHQGDGSLEVRGHARRRRR